MAVADFQITERSVPQATAGERALRRRAQPDLRLYFTVLSIFSVAAFVFGVENRFTTGGLFNIPPNVDWVPPLSSQDWQTAFTLHQQDPAFAACGGTESLAEFKTLYWWEWGRRISILGVASGALLGLAGTGLLRSMRFAFPRLAGLGIAVLAYWAARACVDAAIARVDILSSFNVGQYRHALDVTFAGAIVAAVIASAIAPPLSTIRAPRHFVRWSEWLWLGVIVLNVCFGALFAARDATATWPTWLGYDGQAVPPLDRLLSYAPLWLNFTFNPYMIQLVHRTLSLGLFIAAAWQAVSPMGRSVPLGFAVVRFSLIAVQMLTGIATLSLGAPPALSVTHQLGSIALIACSLVALMAGNGVTHKQARAPAR
jgi:heme a synthase